MAPRSLNKRERRVRCAILGTVTFSVLVLAYLVAGLTHHAPLSDPRAVVHAVQAQHAPLSAASWNARWEARAHQGTLSKEKEAQVRAWLTQKIQEVQDNALNQMVKKDFDIFFPNSQWPEVTDRLAFWERLARELAPGFRIWTSDCCKEDDVRIHFNI